MKRIALVMVLLVANSWAGDQRIAGNLIPESTGYSLGTSLDRWNGKFQNVDIYGTLTCNGTTCIGGIGSLASKVCTGTDKISSYDAVTHTFSCSSDTSTDADAVHKMGDESIAGNKTFTGTVTTPQLCLTGDCKTSWPSGSTGQLSLKDFGAVGDSKTHHSCSITSGTKTLVCTSTPFVSGDVGKKILVMGAGVSGADLVSQIAGYTSSTTITLQDNASTTVTTAGLPNYHSGIVWGTNADDTAAFTAAMAACKGDQTKIGQGGCTLLIPPGMYSLNATQVIAGWNVVNNKTRVTIECVGGYDTTKIVWTGVNEGAAFRAGDGANTATVPPVSIKNCGWQGVDSIHKVTPMQAIRGESHEFSGNRVGNFTKYGVEWSQTWLGEIKFNSFYGGPVESIRFSNLCNVFSQAQRGVDDGCPVNGVTVYHNEIAENYGIGINSIATGQGGSNGNTYEYNDCEGVEATATGCIVLNDSDSRIAFNRFEDNGSTDSTYRSVRLSGARNVVIGNNFSVASPAVANVTSGGLNRFIGNSWSGGTSYMLEVLGENQHKADISIGENLVRERILYSAGTGGTGTATSVSIISQTGLNLGYSALFDNGRVSLKEENSASNPQKTITQQFGLGFTVSYANVALISGNAQPNTPSGAVFGSATKSAVIFNLDLNACSAANPQYCFLGWTCFGGTFTCTSTGGGNYTGATWKKFGELHSNTRREGTAAPVSGTWLTGDYILNTAPSEAGSAGSKYITRGWACTAGGTPGTWLPDRGLTGN